MVTSQIVDPKTFFSVIEHVPETFGFAQDVYFTPLVYKYKVCFFLFTVVFESIIFPIVVLI